MKDFIQKLRKRWRKQNLGKGQKSKSSRNKTQGITHELRTSIKKR